MSVDKDSSSLKPGTFAKAWFLSLLFAFQAASPSFSVALAASTAQTKPPLKAIDSSNAKMDPIPNGVGAFGIQSGSVNGASGNQSFGLPAGGNSPYQFRAQGYGLQGYQPSYPQPGQYQGMPGYAGQSYPNQPPAYPGYQTPNQYGGAPQYGSSQQQYGQLPMYGGGYGGAPAVQAPPGYPQMPPQNGAANQLPPGFVPSGTQQQQQQTPNNFPAGRARLGGGHPNLVPQGAPQSAGPGPAGFAGQGSYPQMNTVQPVYGGGYPQGGYQQPAPGGYGQAPGGYSQPAGYTTGGASAQQFAQTNFPNPNMIPEFGKSLPTDATNKGSAGMWATNQMYPGTAGGADAYGGAAGYGGNGAYGGNGGGNYGPSGAVGNAPSSGGNSQDEARVARLEKVAFGSTYPEHEVEDRVDHLEKEIFGEKSSGDMNSRLQRLEVKLGGSSGSFGSPRSYGGSPSVGTQSLAAAAGSLPSAPRSLSASPGSLADSTASLKAQPESLIAQAASLSAAGQKLALKQPGDEPQPTSPPESGAAESEWDDDAPAPMPADDDDSGAASGSPSSTGDPDSDSESLPPPDTTDGARLPSGKSKEMVAKSPFLKIPFDKGAGDYMNRITTFVNNTTAHWTRFPVRVRLPEDASPEWRKLMEPGVEKWSRYVPLKTANRNESADIEVSFVNHLVPRVLGVTRLTVASGQMKVFIYMLRPSYYPQLPEKTLAGAFLHELGHAIGIFGHSDKPTDAMYTCEVSPSGRGKLTQEKLGAVSSRDINTLKLIYDAEPLPADFNLSAPEEWSLCSGSENNS
jgi:predicted Zn-dependent protease